MEESPAAADPVASAPRWRRGLCAAVLAAAAIASPASAYQTAPNSGGDPNYSSVIRAVEPRTAGVTARILGHDNLVRLVNRSDSTVVVYGYNGDQYARLLPDGSVQLNLRSPAFYLNEYRFGDQTVPRYADAHAPPEWRTMDHSAEIAWHDHRIHTAKAGAQPAGTRPHTLLFSYRIPLRIDGRSGAITGRLYWIGGHSQSSGWELYAAPAAVMLLLLLVYDLARRPRRRRAGARMHEEAAE